MDRAVVHVAPAGSACAAQHCTRGEEAAAHVKMDKNGGTILLQQSAESEEGELYVHVVTLLFWEGIAVFWEGLPWLFVCFLIFKCIPHTRSHNRGAL
jgi:hypothetical protein